MKFMAPDDLRLYRTKDADYTKWILELVGLRGHVLARPESAGYLAEWRDAIARSRA
jgi:hypothetical protein